MLTNKAKWFLEFDN